MEHESMGDAHSRLRPGIIKDSSVTFHFSFLKKRRIVHTMHPQQMPSKSSLKSAREDCPVHPSSDCDWVLLVFFFEMMRTGNMGVVCRVPTQWAETEQSWCEKLQVGPETKYSIRPGHLNKHITPCIPSWLLLYLGEASCRCLLTSWSILQIGNRAFSVVAPSFGNSLSFIH